MDSLKTGTILHGKSYDYKIVKTLGQGTFGITYLASVKMTGSLGSLDSEILVAVKEFFMHDFNGRNESSVTYSSKDGAFAYYKSKFIHEAENLSKLNDSGIIKVIELFEENQTAYYVMEYMSQGSLDNHISAKGHLSSKESVTYGIQIAKALGYMHRNNMLHLDLKPNNIMLKGNNDIVLIDFGLSKRFDANGRPETSTTIGHGTPGYAPIEQANYQGNKSGEFPASMDIYALGATMFKMLTGHRPPEASIILNEGFPFTELKNKGVPKSLVEAVAKCMEPRRKNRYSSVKDVIATLTTLLTQKENQEAGIRPQGYYKQKRGEREYGTFSIENVPVTSSIGFPEFINIKLWDNSKSGKSYEVSMTDSHFEDGYYSRIRIWDRGLLVDEHEFDSGIPKDVKKFIISHGFLSTEHWENESETSPIADDFGTDVSITMGLKDGTVFVRRVTHAHPAYHNLLLDELLELLKSTSLAKELRADKTTLKHPELLSVPDDTFEVIVNYTPSRIGPWKGNDGYTYIINEDRLRESNKGLPSAKFKSFIGSLKILGIHIGPYQKDQKDYSETPGKLDIKFKSRTKGLISLSLIAFNTDMQGGNIYGANIIHLAEALQRIILQYLPQQHEPTRELIYSIPDSTSAILISYEDGGMVGIAQKSIQIGLVNNQRIFTNGYEQIYNPEEFSTVADGLRKLQLRSKKEEDEEPLTGRTFPKLTLWLYDNNGKLLKKIFAQDNSNDKMIGNVVVSVDNLKNELVKLSKSFRDRVAMDENKEEKTPPWTIGNILRRFFLFSIGVLSVAIPTYLFVTPQDGLYIYGCG